MHGSLICSLTACLTIKLGTAQQQLLLVSWPLAIAFTIGHVNQSPAYVKQQELLCNLGVPMK